MKVRVGIIGLGHWGPNLVRCFAVHKNIELVAVCDSNEYVFEKLKIMLPDTCAFHTDYNKLLEDNNIDAITVATPATTHMEIVRRALSAGKHVLCEKPLCFNTETLDSLYELAKKKQKKLMVGYTFLFNNAIHMLKKIITDGGVGNIYCLRSRRTHLGTVRHDVDAVWDLAPHDVAIFNFLMDEPPESVSVMKAFPLGNDNADLGFIILKYPSGVLGEIHVSWIDSNKVRKCEIIGSKAKVVFDDIDQLEPVRIYNKGISASEEPEPDYGAFRYLLHDGDIISPKISMVEPLKQEVDAFIRLVTNGDENPADRKTITNITKIMEAIERSAQSGGIPVEVG